MKKDVLYKSVFLAVLLTIGTGCEKQQPQQAASAPSMEEPDTGCKVVSYGEGLMVECADGYQYLLPQPGSPSPSCTVSQVPEGALITCPDGSVAVVENGQDGKNGEDGLDGQDGSSCSVTPVGSGAVIKCADGTFVLIEDGEDGEPAPSTPYAIVSVIDPCGKESNFDEILLVFANGQILAHYSKGKKQHFALLAPGKYQTTDGTGCKFEVTEDGEIIW